jgi:hypothetical protein
MKPSIPLGSSANARRQYAKKFFRDSIPHYLAAKQAKLALRFKAPERWFTDPYLLSDHIKQQLKINRPVAAIKTVERHTGASNAFVYGTLLAGLSNLGLHSRVVDFWKRKNIESMHEVSDKVKALIEYQHKGRKGGDLNPMVDGKIEGGKTLL